MKRALGPCSVLLTLCTAGCLDLETGGTTSGNSSSSTSGGSSGGGMPGVAIQEWTATNPEGTLEYTLPPWLHIESNTADRTSLWGESFMKRPFGVNAARPRNPGNGWGLSVESKRRNHIQASDSWEGPNWIDPAPLSAMTKLLGNPDPSNGNAATRFESGGSQRSAGVSVPLGYASAWFRGNSDDLLMHFVVSTSEMGWRYRTLSGIDNWNRISLGSGSGAFFLDTMGDPKSGAAPITSPTSVYAYAAQHETDGNGGVVKYPSSYIPTTDKSRVREADSLYSDIVAELFPGGYFHVVVKLAPHYASNEGTSLFHHVLFMNTSNQVRFELDNGKVAVEGIGNSLTGPSSGALIWSREQELTLEIKVTPKGRTLSVSGASEGNFTVTDKEDRPWPNNELVHILGDTSGAQEGADLRYIGFFPPN